MGLRNFGLFLLVISKLIGFSFGLQDPIKDFCRRFGHQTAIIDRKLYIDGGLVNYNSLKDNPANYSNEALLYANLDIENLGMPQVYDNLAKNQSAPSVHGGILWSDPINKLFYLYGGEFYNGSPSPFSLWVYDTLYSSWKISSSPSSSLNILRASYGAGTTDERSGKGYYYGGWLSDASVPGWNGPRIATPSLITYDMTNNTWSNLTGPDSVGRAEGVMVHLPVSENGMLVYFGGIQTPDAPASYTSTGMSMEKILLYDIASSKWYTQEAQGDVPEMRSRFCAGVTWASDKSSYNIYIYGGAGMPPNTTGFDDVYVLSIPSFTWIKFYPTKPTTSYPHHSMTCTVIDGSQMIVMGGTFPTSTDCDEPTILGMHNLDLGRQNAEGTQWSRFSPNLTSYMVPSEISSKIGGGPTGSATVTSPVKGWSDSNLAQVWTHQYTAPARGSDRNVTDSPLSANSSNGSSKKTNVAAIAGGATAGGIVVLLCISGFVYYFRRSQKKKKEEEENKEGQENKVYEDLSKPPISSETTDLLNELPSDTQPKPAYDPRVSYISDVYQPYRSSYGDLSSPYAVSPPTEFTDTSSPLSAIRENSEQRYSLGEWGPNTPPNEQVLPELAGRPIQPVYHEMPARNFSVSSRDPRGNST